MNLFSFLEAFVVERPPGQEFDAAEEFMCEHILSFLCLGVEILGHFQVESGYEFKREMA